MTQTITIGIAAGVLTALLFAALLTGSPVGMLLYLLTPLPAFVAGLSQGHIGAVAAIGAATLLLVAAVHPALGLSYAAIFGMPGWLILRQSLAAGPQRSGMSGHTLALIVLMAGGFGAANVLLLGPDEATYRSELGRVFDFYREQLGAITGTPLPEAEAAVIRDVITRALPAIAAVSWLAIMGFSLWLAGRIARARKTLGGSWPGLAPVELPVWTLFTFMASLLIAYLGTGQAALLASAFAAAHGAGYLVQGLGLVHRLTAGRPFRAGLLIALYVALLVAGYYVAFLVITFALAAPLLGWGGRPPSPPPANTPT
jgi:hypothetical protein